MSDSYAIPSREWWAQRWIDVLESFGFRLRLARARTYAREGYVQRIDFHDAQVSAEVKGTAPEPYHVTLHLDPFTDEQWDYVVESIAEQAWFSAKLLAGEMPHNIEQVFTGNGLSLFPYSKFDIHSRCNCPDPVNPCKHIGAVYYLLGDRFSEDPFVLFQLRGRTKEQILEALRHRRQAATSSIAAPPAPHLASEAEATSIDLTQFWHYAEQLDPSLIVIAPAGQETVLDMLGSIPLPKEIAEPQQSTLFLEYLKSLYAQVSQAAVIQAMTSADDPTQN